MLSMNFYRACFFLILNCCLCAAVAENYAGQYEEDYYDSKLIKPLQNFYQEASVAKQQQKVLLVEFSTPWCEFCEALEQEVLEPLVRSNRYQNKVIIRKLEINDYSNVIGFDNRQYDTESISMQYKISLYPTLVFFDSEGNEISSRLVGIKTFDYIGEELDEAIVKAIDTLKQ